MYVCNIIVYPVHEYARTYADFGMYVDLCMQACVYMCMHYICSVCIGMCVC
jgi:hypothetical protein